VEEDIRALIQNLVRKLGLINAFCCETCCNQEISVVHCHILHEINKLKNPSMQQVAENLAVDITTFSRQIKTLMDKGLVSKASLPEDRRINILSLTARGEEVNRQIDRYMEEYFSHILAQFTEFEKDTVIQSLKLLNKAISRHCC
jgi:DNA-binding MarR family transcriptional regulator